MRLGLFINNGVILTQLALLSFLSDIDVPVRKILHGYIQRNISYSESNSKICYDFRQQDAARPRFEDFESYTSRKECFEGLTHPNNTGQRFGRNSQVDKEFDVAIQCRIQELS